MGERLLYEYAVLRVVPRVEREEFLNAGVLLWCRARELLAVAAPLDLARVLLLDPGADLAAVRAALDAVAGVCRGKGPAAATTPGERFRWLTSPRSTVVQPGPVHAGLATDPAAELQRLAGLLVGPART